MTNLGTKSAKTANQVVDDAYVSSTTVGSDLTSTGGMQEAIRANARAIRLLADHVDGIVTDPATGERTKNGKPVE